MTHPIAAAVEFAAALGFPVLTADIPAVVAAIHRHYALGLRDAAPHANGLVLAEREACAQLCVGLKTGADWRVDPAQSLADEMADNCADAIRARSTP